MRKDYSEVVIEILSLAEDVLTSSVVGEDNYTTWSWNWESGNGKGDYR